MRLTSRAIVTYNNVNSFMYGNQWSVNSGDASTLYFQIFDLDQGPQSSIGNIPFSNMPLNNGNGLRYIVGVGITSPATYGVTVTFPSIDPAKTITIAATQVSPLDGSLWSVSIPSAQQPGGGNVIFSVREDTSVKTFSTLNMLAVNFPYSDGEC